MDSSEEETQQKLTTTSISRMKRFVSFAKSYAGFGSVLISLLALFISAIDSQLVLAKLVKPVVTYTVDTLERTPELLVMRYKIKNSGNRAAEDIELQIASFEFQHYSISDINSFDTALVIRNGILWANFKRKYLVPEDSILIAIECDTTTLNIYRRNLERQGENTRSKQIPNLVYFKSRDGFAKLKIN